MGKSRTRSLLRAGASVGLAALAGALVGAPAATAAPRECTAATVATSSVRQIDRTLLCLTNVERGRHGLSQVRWSRELAGVAARHARDMVARRYFAHVSPAGTDHMDRIAASRYKPARGCWTAGENLMEATGVVSPRRLFRAWMQSPIHRRTILTRGWRDFGLGVVRGSPAGGPQGLTVVALYGTRSSRACG
jgi:uncharacterized protein YkwD